MALPENEPNGTIQLGEKAIIMLRGSFRLFQHDDLSLISLRRNYLEPLNKVKTLAWIFFAAVLAITGIYVFFTYRFIHRPLLTLVKSFRKLEHGDLNISIAA